MDKLYFPADSIILDIEVDREVLGLSFRAIGNTIIDVQHEKSTLHVQG